VLTRRVQGPRRRQVLDHCLHNNSNENLMFVKNLRIHIRTRAYGSRSRFLITAFS
jgi:hypothetical protein